MYYYFLFRKIIFSLLVLVGIGVIILLVRFFWGSPEERPFTQIPIQSPTQQASQEPAASLEKKADFLKTEDSVSETKPKSLKPVEDSKESIAAAPSPEAESKTTSPPAILEKKPAPPVPKAEAKTSVSLPLPEINKGPQPKEQKKEGKAKEVTSKTKASLPDSKKSESKNKLQADQNTLIIKPGDSIYAIAEKTYQISNTSVVDRIMELNPKIADPNQLPANQKIKLPEITEESLIIPSSDSAVMIKLGTFTKPEYANFLKGQPALQGKEIKITPWQTPSGQTFYRATAGDFDSREEGLEAIRFLKEKGLSPYFEGFKKKN